MRNCFELHATTENMTTVRDRRSTRPSWRRPPRRRLRASGGLRTGTPRAASWARRACRPRCVADGGRDMDPHPHGHRRGDGYGACAEARRARRRVPRSSSFPGPSTRTSRWPCGAGVWNRAPGHPSCRAGSTTCNRRSTTVRACRRSGSTRRFGWTTWRTRTGGDRLDARLPALHHRVEHGRAQSVECLSPCVRRHLGERGGFTGHACGDRGDRSPARGRNLTEGDERPSA
ncbi:hypothetical protein Br6_01019 [Rhodococcus sp. Br-6]|nr:hypothetical protein Br6_01019 [Rhodococcus sp. Br-6]